MISFYVRHFLFRKKKIWPEVPHSATKQRLMRLIFWISCYLFLNLTRPGDLDPGKVPGFNLRALNCCLTLKLGVCFQIYKLTSHEKKNWSKSQKVSEILKFENFMALRFFQDLTHENGRNSLNF